MHGCIHGRIHGMAEIGGGPRLAIGAIFRNEAPYVLEWVAYHRALGVRCFLIADNASDDGSSALLADLDRAGVLTHIPFPGDPGLPPQLPAYAEILRRLGGAADWIAFIDADEFLLPAPPFRTLAPILAGFGPEVGAVAVNWALYGSSGETAARPEPVIERFTARAQRQSRLSRHFKSILRPAAFAGLHATPHLFRLRPGRALVHADGSPLEPLNERLPGLSRAVPWAPLRLNHYVVKSREEFFDRKLPRGRATRSRRREPEFFAAHDRNDVLDPVPPWLVEAARAERLRLEALLAPAPLPA